MTGSLATLTAAIESHLNGKRLGTAPEPLARFSRLQAASHDLYERYERAEQALPPPDVKRRAAISKFRQAQRLSASEWRMVFSGLSDKTSHVGPILDDGPLFDRIHQEVQTRISQRSLGRRDWLALCFSYFGYDAQTPDVNSSWCTLRQDIKQGFASIKAQQVREKEWIRIVDQYEALFSETAGEHLGEQMFNGEIEDLSVLQAIAQIPDSSWLWRRIFNVLLSRIFGLDDRTFEARTPGFMQLGAQHPAYINEILSACLTRYHQAAYREKPSPLLKQAALDNWGSPQMRSRENRWLQHVNAEVCAMVVAWFAKEDLEHFFNLLKGDADVDQARLFYWLRFTRQMSYTRIVMGVDAKTNSTADFTDFRKKNNGRLSYLTGGKASNNAVIMQIGDYLFVEFSEKSNACYVYKADSAPFDPGRTILDMKLELKQKLKSPVKPMVHKLLPTRPNHVSGWLATFDENLAQLGIRPDDYVKPPVIQPRAQPQVTDAFEAPLLEALKGIGYQIFDSRDKGGAFQVQLERQDPVAMAALQRLGFKQVNQQSLRFWRV